MKLLQDYTIIIRPDDNSTFVAYVPAIPGCHAWGKTLDEACAEIVNVFEMIKEEYVKKGRFLPEDVELLIANANVTLKTEVSENTEQKIKESEKLIQQHQALSKLTKEWIEEGDEKEQTETWNYLHQALNEEGILS